MAGKIRERRLAVHRPEFRASSDTLTLEGYASTTGESYDMGWYREMVAPGAFKRTLGQNPDVRLLINHDGLPLARTSSGTLELSEDDKGLFSRAALDLSSPTVQSLESAMRRGDLDKMSFGFYVNEQDWSPDYDQRTLREVDLHDGDVSVVTYPANPGTSAAIRAGGAPGVEAILGVLRALEQRAAAPDEVAGVLQRALGYLASVDAIVDLAQADVASELGVPNPDDDDTRAAVRLSETTERRADPLVGLELRRRALALLA